MNAETDAHNAKSQVLLAQVLSLINHENSSSAERTLATHLVSVSQRLDLLRAQREGHDSRIQQIERTISRLDGTMRLMTEQLTHMSYYNQALLDRFCGQVATQVVTQTSSPSISPDSTPHTTPQPPRYKGLSQYFSRHLRQLQMMQRTP